MSAVSTGCASWATSGVAENTAEPITKSAPSAARKFFMTPGMDAFFRDAIHGRERNSDPQPSKDNFSRQACLNHIGETDATGLARAMLHFRLIRAADAGGF